MKTCKNCKESLPEDQFPTYSTRKGRGRRGVCRECWNKKWSPIIVQHQNRYYHENRNGLADRAKARAKKSYQADPHAQYKRSREYAERHPEKTAARIAVLIAVRSGRLKRLPCQVCGSSKVDAHHEDYSKPLEVIWLCRTHHGERHREINRGRAA